MAVKKLIPLTRSGRRPCCCAVLAVGPLVRTAPVLHNPNPTRPDETVASTVRCFGRRCFGKWHGLGRPHSHD